MAGFSGAAAAAIVLAAARPVVCVDPGHSAVTVGAVGRHSAEYRVTWNIARRLERALTHDGFTVVLTKSSADQNVSNQSRAACANRARAALFIRLHCDSGTRHGFAVYYPELEGHAEGAVGPGPDVRAASGVAARSLYRAMDRSLAGALPGRGVLTDRDTAVGRRQGALTGSVFSTRPVLLVEMCVLSNRADEAFITSSRGAARMARALAAGVEAAVRALQSSPASSR